MARDHTARMRAAHRCLSKFPFEVVRLRRGYADRILRIDLDRMEIGIAPVTQQMKDLWVGGKGFDLWLMLQEVTRETRWDSPENPICFSVGPLGGTTSFPGAGKTIVTTLSPLTGSVMDCNVGGYFGPFLKFAGFDALTVVGKAPEEAAILIDAVEGMITIETAPEESIDAHLLAEELTEMLAADDMDRRNIAVVAAGRGADHTRMGVLNFSFWDWRRKVARLKQAGRGGIGTVFRNKKLKAMALRGREIAPVWRIAKSKAAALAEPPAVDGGLCRHEAEAVAAIAAAHGSDPEQATEMLLEVQERFRRVSPTALETIAAATGAPLARLYHIATFYKAFSLERRGRTTIQVCMGAACHAKGAGLVLEAFERHLGVAPGGTTADGAYSLEAVACLGACGLAPVIQVGEELIGGVKPAEVPKLVARLAEPEPPRPGGQDAGPSKKSGKEGPCRD